MVAKSIRRERADRRNQIRTERNAVARETPIAIAEPDTPVRRHTVKTQLDILHGRDAISVEEKVAGERLYRDWFRSGMSPKLVSGLYGMSGASRSSGPVSSVTEMSADASHAVNQAIRAVGLILSPVLIDVCIWDVSAGDWAVNHHKPRADGPALLRAALSALVIHYSEAKAKTP